MQRRSVALQEQRCGVVFALVALLAGDERSGLGIAVCALVAGVLVIICVEGQRGIVTISPAHYAER